MNDELKRVNGQLFQSYVGDNFPLYSDTSYGHFVIVDNTGPINIQGLLPNTYNVFVDHIHIASGYGFSTVEDFNEEIKRITYAYNGVIDLYEYNKNNENTSLFNLKLVDNYGNNHFSSYNAYGFETSYRSITVNHVFSEDYKYSYEIRVNKYDLNYINPVDIEYKKDDNDIEITSVYKTESFPINIKISKNVGDDEGFNALISHESVQINGKNLADPAVPSSNGLRPVGSPTGDFNTYIFQFNVDTNEYVQDLKIDYLFDNEIVSSYVVPNLLKWTEKMFIYPTNYAIDTAGLILDDNSEDNSTFIGNKMSNLYGSSISNDDKELLNSNTLFVFPNEMIDVEFSSGSNFLYDFIVILEEFKPEFYYNGIKSENWQIIAQDIPDRYEGSKKNNIWRSPQKYSGLHTWQIKLKT